MPGCGCRYPSLAWYLRSLSMCILVTDDCDDEENALRYSSFTQTAVALLCSRWPRLSRIQARLSAVAVPRAKRNTSAYIVDMDLFVECDNLLAM